jgi:hypothetical protein
VIKKVTRLEKRHLSFLPAFHFIHSFPPFFVKNDEQIFHLLKNDFFGQDFKK